MLDPSYREALRAKLIADLDDAGWEECAGDDSEAVVALLVAPGQIEVITVRWKERDCGPPPML